MGLKIELFPAKATGTGLDGLKREDFKTDEAFLEAATQRQMELDNPAYIKARTKLRQFAAASLAAPLPIFAPTSFLPCGPCFRRLFCSLLTMIIIQQSLNVAKCF
ncbi:MAG: hypothetical protein HFF72_02210 [Oscillospiraceae bacterium]|nr:hypothetical protein [Oscillospiraceae bacterium]